MTARGVPRGAGEPQVPSRTRRRQLAGFKRQAPGLIAISPTATRVMPHRKVYDSCQASIAPRHQRGGASEASR